MKYKRLILTIVLLKVIFLSHSQTTAGRCSKIEFVNQFENIVTAGEKNKNGYKTIYVENYIIHLTIDIDRNNITCLQCNTYCYKIESTVNKDDFKTAGIKHFVGICENENLDKEEYWISYSKDYPTKTEIITFDKNDIIIQSEGFNGYNLLKILNEKHE